MDEKVEYCLKQMLRDPMVGVWFRQELLLYTGYTAYLYPVYECAPFAGERRYVCAHMYAGSARTLIVDISTLNMRYTLVTGAISLTPIEKEYAHAEIVDIEKMKKRWTKIQQR